MNIKSRTLETCHTLTSRTTALRLDVSTYRQPLLAAEATYVGITMQNPLGLGMQLDPSAKPVVSSSTQEESSSNITAQSLGAYKSWYTIRSPSVRKNNLTGMSRRNCRLRRPRIMVLNIMAGRLWYMPTKYPSLRMMYIRSISHSLKETVLADSYNN